MFKKMEAFFKTEKDAMGAKDRLQNLTTENEIVEVIPADANLASIVPIENNGRLVGSASFLDVLDPTNDGIFSDKKYLTHLLQFKVQEEEYEQAISVIQDYGGHMDERKI